MKQRGTSQPPRSRASGAVQLPVAIATYNLAQVGVMLASKALLERFAVNITFTVYFVQCACSVTVLSIFERWCWIGITPIKPGMLKYVIPVVLAGVVAEWTFHTSMEYLSVSIGSAISQLRVVAIFIGSIVWQWLRTRSVSDALFNRRVVGACGVMTLGMVIAGVTDPAFSMEGYVWGFIAVFFGAIHTVSASKMMELSGMKPLSAVFYSDLLSIAILPIAMVLLGELEVLGDNWTLLSSVQFQAYIVGTSVLRFTAALAGTWILYIASPVAYSLVVSVARVPTVLFGSYLFNAPTHTGGMISVVIALFGGLYYSWTTREHSHHVHL